MNLYKCIDCGCVFETLDAAEICIQCGSDNITPIKRMPALIKGLIVGLLGVPIGYAVALGIGTLVTEKPDEIVMIDNGTMTFTETLPVNPENNEIDIPKITEVTEPQYKNGGYSFEVIVYSESHADLYYELSNPTNNYTSEDGKFENIAYTEDGIYILKVTNTKNGTYDEKTLSGFVRPAEMVTPYTKGDLQKIINNPSASFTRDMASRFGKYKMEFVGLDPEEPAPTRFAEILNAISGNAWKSATVIGEPKYDHLNRITYLKIKVVYY